MIEIRNSHNEVVRHVSSKIAAFKVVELLDKRNPQAGPHFIPTAR